MKATVKLYCVDIIEKNGDMYKVIETVQCGKYQDATPKANKTIKKKGYENVTTTAVYITKMDVEVNL